MNKISSKLRCQDIKHINLILILVYCELKFFVAQYIILQFLLSQNINLRLPEYLMII